MIQSVRGVNSGCFVVEVFKDIVNVYRLQKCQSFFKPVFYFCNFLKYKFFGTKDIERMKEINKRQITFIQIKFKYLAINSGILSFVFKQSTDISTKQKNISEIMIKCRVFLLIASFFINFG
jgi:hypothetical protein